MADFSQFLDTLSDDELQLMDSDPEFFNQVKSTYEASNKPKGPGFMESLAIAAKPALGGSSGFISIEIPALIQKGEEKAGEHVATSFAEHGIPTSPVPFSPGKNIQVSPEVAAGIGYGAQFLPEVAMAASAPVEPVIKGIQTAVTAPVAAPIRKIGQMVKTLKAPGEAEARALAEQAVTKFVPTAEEKAAKYATQQLSPLQRKISKLQSSLKEIPQQTAKKMETLKKLESASKQAISSAEKEMGIEAATSPKFEQFVRSPQKVAKVAQRLQRFENMTPEEVAKTISPKRIQLYRKVAQESPESMSGIARSQLMKGREKMAKALESLSGDFKKARSSFQEVKDAIQTLPKEAKQKIAAFKDALKSSRTELSTQTKELNQLKSAARKADAQELQAIKDKASELVVQGVKKDQLVGTLKRAAITAAVGSGLAVAAAKMIL